MTSKIVTEDGRKMEKPEYIPFKITIGKKTRVNKGYITDELMTINTPSGWLINEEIPDPLRRFITKPELVSEMGDIRVWECPAGSHIKPERLRRILNKEEGIKVESYRENEGRHNETRIDLKVDTGDIDD